MKPLAIQDPKTFNEPNYNLINPVVEQFFFENKEKFLSMYYELSNTDKFYALSACVMNFTDTDMAKRMFLEELRPDLTNMKHLNKPNGKDFGFGYKYNGYNSALPIVNVWDNIDKIKIPKLV